MIRIIRRAHSAETDTIADAFLSMGSHLDAILLPDIDSTAGLRDPRRLQSSTVPNARRQGLVCAAGRTRSGNSLGTARGLLCLSNDRLTPRRSIQSRLAVVTAAWSGSVHGKVV